MFRRDIISRNIIFYILGLFFLGAIFYSVHSTTNEWEKGINSIESLLGKSIVWKSDTLIVVDYSILNNTYTLEDGTVINMAIIEKLDTVTVK